MITAAPAIVASPNTTKRDRALFLIIHTSTIALMACAFLLAGSWTALLIAIQLVPTQVANYIMNTAELDFGDFWILARGDDSIVIPAVVLLVFLAASYYGLSIVVVYRGLCSRGSTARINPAVHSYLTPERPPEAPVLRISSTQRLRRQLAKMEDSSLQSLPKLVLQTITLFSYLDQGFPTPLVFSYSTLLCCNWMIAGYCTIKRAFSPTTLIVRVFYCFDLFFAVLAPLQVLVFACYNFKFNRAEFATRTETLASAGFDRTARLFADPTQVSLFRIAFQSLQFTSWWSLVIRGGLNIVTIRRWWHVVWLTGKWLPRNSPSTVTVVRSTHPLMRCLCSRNHVVGVTFIVLGIFFTICSIVSALSARLACKAFTQCRVPSYVMSQQCSCVVFVDRETRVSTFSEWENPVDASAQLAVLAAAGKLKIVQIVNRQLPTLPKELRRCHQLEQLVLIYSKITFVPEWVNEFSELKYLHIEGDHTPKKLFDLPAKFFVKMPKLLFLHLGTLTKVPFVPDLDHLHRLKYLTLAALYGVNELPNLDGLSSLEQLNIVDMTQVHSLPRLAGLTSLRAFALTAREPVCCNGFITGVCDLSAFSCLDRTASGERPVVCSTARMASEDHAVLEKKGGLVCEKNLTFDLQKVQPTAASISICGGVMYAQCSLRGLTGMCFPSRMTPIACQVNPGYQAMRRLQIRRSVGDPSGQLYYEHGGARLRRFLDPRAWR